MSRRWPENRKRFLTSIKQITPLTYAVERRSDFRYVLYVDCGINMLELRNV